jgi:hypothetical protein
MIISDVHSDPQFSLNINICKMVMMIRAHCDIMLSMAVKKRNDVQFRFVFDAISGLLSSQVSHLNDA